MVGIARVREPAARARVWGCGLSDEDPRVRSGLVRCGVRFLLCTLGSHGDVHPSIALAHALRERGHEGVVATNPYFAPLLKAHGVAFWPLGEHQDLATIMQRPNMMSEWSGATKLAKRLLLPMLEDVTRSLLAGVRELRPRAMVGHPLTLTLPSVSEATGVAWAMASLAPLSWLNPQDRPVYTPWDRTTPPQWLCHCSLWLGRLAMRRGIDQAINAVRKGLGLAAERDHWYRLCRGGAVNLGLWSPAFRAREAGDPATGEIVGFPWMDRALGHEDDVAKVDRFLDAGDPPLVFTLGTASVHTGAAFFGAAISAATALGQRAMLVAGKREYVPGSLPQGVEAFTYAPYSRVFPRGLVNIHHGGIGTTAQALRAGRPQLVTACAYDQFDNAARVARLGVGLRERREVASPRRLIDKLERLIREPMFAQRARELAPRVTQDGAAAGAEVLLRAFG